MIFWLWTPRFLLHRKISLRSLLPGALLATFVVGGTIATSPLWIGPTLNQNAKAFGSFGVVLGLFAYILIVVTISMVCAVFAPVWAEWRQGEEATEGPGAERPMSGRSRQLCRASRGIGRVTPGLGPAGASIALVRRRVDGRGGRRSCSDCRGAQHRPRQRGIRAQGSGRQAALARPARLRGRHGRRRLRRCPAAAAQLAAHPSAALSRRVDLGHDLEHEEPPALQAHVLDRRGDRRRDRRAARGSGRLLVQRDLRLHDGAGRQRRHQGSVSRGARSLASDRRPGAADRRRAGRDLAGDAAPGKPTGSGSPCW